MTGTLGGSVVAGKGFVICCHDQYGSNAEMMKQKKTSTVGISVSGPYPEGLNVRNPGDWLKGFPR